MWEWYDDGEKLIINYLWNALGRGHDKIDKHGKTSKGNQRYYCPNCQQTHTETFDTIYYRRQVEPEKIQMVLQAPRRRE